MGAQVLYVTSENLVLEKRDNDYVAFDSKLGGLCIVDYKIAELFERLKSPATLQQISADGKYSVEYVRTFVQTFSGRDFVHKVDFISGRHTGVKSGGIHNKIKVIQLIVSNLCNFNCKYCFTNSIYSSLERLNCQQNPNNKTMSIDDADKYIKKTIELVKKSGERSLLIQFFGGEPLVNWKVIEYVLDSFKNGQEFDVDISYSIVTNGSLIDQQKAFYFKKYNMPVVVSFDSPEGDDRVMKNGKNSFLEIKNGLRILKEENNRVIFNSVLSKETYPYFSTTIIDFALQYNVQEIGILLDLDIEFYDLYASESIVNKLWEIYSYAKKNNIVVTGYWHTIFQLMVSFDYFETRGYKMCSGTGCQLSIEPSGDVFACKGSSGYYGHILNPGEMLKSPTYEAYSDRSSKNPPECLGCDIEHFCSGFCLGPLEKKFKNINKIVPQACAVYRGITKKLLMSVEAYEVPRYTSYD